MYMYVAALGLYLESFIKSVRKLDTINYKVSSVHCSYTHVHVHCIYAGHTAATPQNLPGISAAFVNLLIHTTSGEIPLGSVDMTMLYSRIDCILDMYSVHVHVVSQSYAV